MAVKENGEPSEKSEQYFLVSDPSDQMITSILKFGIEIKTRDVDSANSVDQERRSAQPCASTRCQTNREEENYCSAGLKLDYLTPQSLVLPDPAAKQTPIW